MSSEEYCLSSCRKEGHPIHQCAFLRYTSHAIHWFICDDPDWQREIRIIDAEPSEKP